MFKCVLISKCFFCISLGTVFMFQINANLRAVNASNGTFQLWGLNVFMSLLWEDGVLHLQTVE